ncbi:hypothetical protein WR25_15010 [Diploscapter pachys]|uniref:Uncharacterized protein n=1 Tax=Diploscapter pachys TaxID=2018661 RepID=A0A2A2LIM2_9BILA|nr:hypothetical protein WR25_15010 [Diploscapter pachys]
MPCPAPITAPWRLTSALPLRARDLAIEIAAAGQAATAVVQVRGDQVEVALGAQDAELVEQLAAAVAGPGLAADQALVAVVEVVDGQCQCAVGLDLAAAIVPALALQGQQVLTHQAATAVVQLPRVDMGGAHAVHQALGLVVQQPADLGGERAVAEQFALLAVVEAGSVQCQRLVGSQHALAIVHRLGDGQRQRPASDRTLTVVEAVCRYLAEAGAGNLAVAVVDGCARDQCQARLAGDHAALVVQGQGADIQAVGRHQAIEVVEQLVEAHGQGLFAVELAARVVEAAARQGEGALAEDLAMLVVDIGDLAQAQLVGGDLAVAVVQLAMVQVQGQRGDAAQVTALLVEPADIDADCLVAADMTALAVVQGLGAQVEGGLAGDPASAVVHQPLAGDGDAAVGQDLASAVVQAAEVQGQGIEAGQFAGLVVQMGPGGVQRALAGDLATVAVEQLATGEGHAPVGEDLALLAVVQGRGVDAEVAPGTEAAALVVQAAAGGDAQVAAGDQALVAVVHRTGADLQVGAGHALTIDVDTRLDTAKVAQLAASVQLYLAPGGQPLAVDQLAAAVQLQLLAGMHRALRIDSRRLQAYVAAGAGLGHVQLAVGLELDIAAAGDHPPLSTLLALSPAPSMAIWPWSTW